MATKTEIRGWMSRVRSDMRLIERALKTNNPTLAFEAAEDGSGSAGEVQLLVAALWPEQFKEWAQEDPTQST